MTIRLDRRGEPRFQTHIPAVLFIGPGDARIDGTIADVSEGGARIEVEAGQDAVLAFLEPGAPLRLLETTSENIYECELRWRDVRNLGLQFIDLATRAQRQALLARIRDEIPSP